MATVLIQIGLSSGRPRDYDALAQFMQQSGWQTTLADAGGQSHPLPPGTYVGAHDDPSKLAADLQSDLRNSGLDGRPTILTATIQDWTLVS